MPAAAPAEEAPPVEGQPVAAQPPAPQAARAGGNGVHAQDTLAIAENHADGGGDAAAAGLAHVPSTMERTLRVDGTVLSDIDTTYLTGAVVGRVLKRRRGVNSGAEREGWSIIGVVHQRDGDATGALTTPALVLRTAPSPMSSMPPRLLFRRNVLNTVEEVSLAFVIDVQKSSSDRKKKNRPESTKTHAKHPLFASLSISTLPTGFFFFSPPPDVAF